MLANRLKCSSNLRAGLAANIRRQANRSFRIMSAQDQAVKYQFDDSNLPANHSDGSNVDLRDIHLDFADRRLTFNSTWLRNSCNCEICFHKPSGQRHFKPTQFTKDVFSIKDIKLLNYSSSGGNTRLVGGKNLGIKWADDHESVFQLEWLRSVDDCFKNSDRVINLQEKTAQQRLPSDSLYCPIVNNNSTKLMPWTVRKIKQELKTVHYDELVNGFLLDESNAYRRSNLPAEMSTTRYEAMRTLVHQLATTGLVKIVGVPQEPETILKVARTIAYERTTGYGTIFDVVVEPDGEINLAYSTQEFDLHTDLPYRESSPGAQLLHCIRNSMQGGDSYFSDALQACDLLSESHPDLLRVLSQFPATFSARDPYRDVRFRLQRPMVELDSQGCLQSIYYSPFMQPPIGHHEDVKLFYLAYDRLSQLLQSKDLKYVCKMDPGDLFIFHNRRVLHGRSAYDNSGKNNRFLQGTYMDWDEIVCLDEKFRAFEATKNRK